MFIFNGKKAHKFLANLKGYFCNQSGHSCRAQSLTQTVWKTCGKTYHWNTCPFTWLTICTGASFQRCTWHLLLFPNIQSSSFADALLCQGRGSFPDPNDCRKFYHCPFADGQKAYHYKCPSDRPLFNATLQSCINAPGASFIRFNFSPIKSLKI